MNMNYNDLTTIYRSILTQQFVFLVLFTIFHFDLKSCMLGRKVICVRCINCSYNNVAKGMRLLNKKHLLFIQENSMQVRAFERYTPLKYHKESGSLTKCMVFDSLVPCLNVSVFRVVYFENINRCWVSD